ncbi:hypothetical protein [Gracilimonas tropica]|uniref:hypothetical protein n=1 Tax=Gracilimonas tropica TaxID=454600 RepID=UPI00035D01EA|nr:hypothetical protein [Gracilimonas tropica]
MISSKEYKANKRTRNLIRLSLLLIIMPVLYLGLWISILQNEALTYAGQVQLLMSYFPEFLRNPFGITLTFFGMSFSSAIFGFYGYLKADSNKAQLLSLFLSGIATLITIWYGFTLM